MKSPGITITPLTNMLNSAAFNELFLDNVRIPRENLVGELNRGWYVATTTLDFERSGIQRIVFAADAAGRPDRLREGRARTAAGADRQAGVRHRLAELQIEFHGRPHARRTASPGCRGAGWCRTPRHRSRSCTRRSCSRGSRRCASICPARRARYRVTRRVRRSTAASAQLLSGGGLVHDRRRHVGSAAEHHRAARAGAAARLTPDEDRPEVSDQRPPWSANQRSMPGDPSDSAGASAARGCRLPCRPNADRKRSTSSRSIFMSLLTRRRRRTAARRSARRPCA